MSNDSQCFLKWREAWLLDHELIDSQHLAMANLLNLLADSHNSVSPVRPVELLLQLQEETRKHFSDEEQLMRESDYPELAAHHREHAVLLAELQDFIREIENGKKSLNNGTLTSLKYWLIDHVLTTDKKFVTYVKRRG